MFLVNLAVVSTVDLESIISCEKYGNLDQLLRVTSHLLQFVSNLKSQLKKCDAIVGELQPEKVEYSLGL